MKVSVTYSIPKSGIELLKNKHEVWVNPEDRSLTKEELIELAKTSDAMITMLADKIDKDVLDAGKGKLKIVSNYAVGFNNIDSEYAKSVGIYVTNTPGVLTNATADLAWALMMAVSRKLVEGDKFVREGKFTGWKPELFLGGDLYGKTLGVIGFGRIGQAFAKRALGFDMKVLYNQRNRVDENTEKSLNAAYADVDTIMAESDFIALHVPLTPETHHLINEERLSMMKPTAYLINTARGPVIDETVLVKFLKEKKIAGAAFDVYENEPKLAEGLDQLDNVVLAPHIGSGTVETRENMSMMVATNIIDALDGKIPQQLVYKI